MRVIRTATWVSILGGALLLSAAVARGDQIASARATINSCVDGSFVGTALLVERPSSEGVKVIDLLVSVRGLSAGKHAVHIHEVGNCTPCAAAGSHLDLGPFGQNVPVTANHPFHSGDLVNVRVGADGRGVMTTTTSRVALSPEDNKLSIFDVDGSSLVIHALPDVYCPDPSDPNCAGGGRTACGILQRVQ
jgi:Cu-Zn family superoxide dismutase